MRDPWTHARAVALALAAIVGVLAGCASDPRYSQGLQWVVEQEAERQRLQAQGFPQYNRE